MNPPIFVPGLPTAGPALSPEFEREVRESIEAALDTAAAASPKRFRIGPDVTFVVPQSDGSSRTFELVGNGTFLRDPETRQRWPFKPGKNMLKELAVIRRLAPLSPPKPQKKLKK